MFSEKAKKLIDAPIPPDLIKERPGPGKAKLQYVSGSYVIDTLNTAFDRLWSWEIVREWIQPSEPKFNPKYDSEPVPQGPVAHVVGKLTVWLPTNDGNYFPLVKMGYGSKAILGSQSDQESIFKAAGTDALKKAASLLGIGLQLYRDEEEQMYYEELNYEDPWTDEMKEKYKEEREYINDITQQYELDVNDLNELVAEFSEGALVSIRDITPDNIEAFVAYLKMTVQQVESQVSEEEEEE